MFLRSLVTIACSLLTWPVEAQFGAATIQQPVVSFFGVSTTISVPDRGSGLIGGVSSAASGSNRFGPIPYGTSSGSSASASSLQTRVWIHDPAETDAALLRIGEGQVTGLTAAAQEQRARDIMRKRSGMGAVSSMNGQNSLDRARALQILRTRR